MFNLFKKKNNISDADICFLENIVEKLPHKYGYLKKQINTEFLLGKKPNVLGKGRTFTLILNANLEQTYINKNMPDLFIIKDILVWNKVNKINESVELHIVQGMLAGFRLDCDYDDLELSKISMTNVKEKHFLNKDKKEIEKLFIGIKPDVKAMLDIEMAFKTIIDGKDYFIIKDLGDGNYISVDIFGKVYGMIHDPYEIDEIFENTDDFLSELSTGEFRLESYINRKLS